MANVRLGAKAAVSVPALTDKHTITQAGTDYSETNAQILALKHTISDTTESTTKDTGSIVTEGGIGAEKNIVNGGFLKSGLGRWPTAKLNGSKTTNEIFDALSPYLPNTNDEILIHGALVTTGSDVHVISYAYRYNATRIYMLSALPSGTSSVAIDDGGSTSYLVNIAW